MHISEELYLLLLRGVLEPSALATAAHGHALETCDRCRDEWLRFRSDLEGEGELADGPPAPRSMAAPAPPEDPDTLSVADVDRWKALVSRMRHETRKAREDVGELLKVPPDEWEEKLERSHSRFRSRAFAQHLLTRCRREVREEPRLAARLAALVPVVLHRLPGADGEPWGMALRVRAEAYRANAERVAGDLAAAARRFAALRRRLAERPLADAGVLAEVDSLEASLCIGQRRLGEAEWLLRAAVAGACRSGHRRVLGRALIQMASVQWTRGRAEQALETLDAAAEELDPDDRSYERACLLSCRLMALCDLERYAEAERLLDDAEPLLARLPHGGAYANGIRGRAALGLERWDEAADCFRAARDTLLDLGRDYDAALTCLDLAHAHLGAGDTARLRELAAGLVPTFRARDVARETLAVLRLLTEAVEQDRATVTLLEKLRWRLHNTEG